MASRFTTVSKDEILKGLMKQLQQKIPRKGKNLAYWHLLVEKNFLTEFATKS